MNAFPRSWRLITSRALLVAQRANRDTRYEHNWARGSSDKSHGRTYGRVVLLASSSTFVGGIAALSLEDKEEPGSPIGATGTPKYADRKAMLQAVTKITEILGEDFVSFDEDEIEAHGHSDWSTSNTKVRPIAIVSPGSTEEVSKIAGICTQYRVPMVPFGAGSSVEGNFSSPHSGVCIDLSRMNKTIAFHEDDMDVVVQPGVNWLDLNKSIAKSGLFLPLDPGPTAHIGGMVATNCSGTNAMRYGTMKDWVINLTVVLADGTIMKTRHRPRKTSAGYNLTALFTGSEGTLGIITEVTLKLAVIPEKINVAIVAFPTIRDAATAASRFMRDGVPMAALELMDETQMKIINKNGGAGGRLWRELPTLFLKFSGTQRSIDDDIARIKRISDTHNGGEFLVATTKEEMDNLWAARKDALWASLAVRPEGTRYGQPTWQYLSLKWRRSLVKLSKQESSKLGLFSSILGHVGDGNFHQSVMYNPDKPEEMKAVGDCVHRMMIRAIEMEGTVSGEHGIGLGKKECLEEELGPVTLSVMRTLKRSLGPYWLLNPGKIFDAES